MVISRVFVIDSEPATREAGHPPDLPFSQYRRMPLIGIASTFSSLTGTP